MPLHVLVLHVFEVTVTVTMQLVCAGVLVMVKLFEVSALSRVSVKKAVPPDSAFAFTITVAPVLGMGSIFTTNGKFGPGAGGSTVPTAGMVDAFIACSPQPPSLPSFFFLQLSVTVSTNRTANPRIIFFIIGRDRFIERYIS